MKWTCELFEFEPSGGIIVAWYEGTTAVAAFHQTINSDWYSITIIFIVPVSNEVIMLRSDSVQTAVAVLFLCNGKRLDTTYISSLDVNV